ncbi:MAG: polyribonucleotide nucleotidyltransferase [bacterium]
MINEEKIELGGRTLSIEAGRVARQSDGAVFVRYGDTVVLVTAVVGKEPMEGADFLPLLVEYREKSYAAGKIPGGFFKREGRPTEKEILSARLIDRPIRSLIPDGFTNEVQIIATVLSSDQQNDSDVLALIGASAAMGIAGAPFGGPVGVVRIGRKGDEYIVNPTFAEREEGDIEVVIVGVGDQVVMIEGGMKEVSEEAFLEAIRLGLETLAPIIAMQRALMAKCGSPPMPYTLRSCSPEIFEAVRGLCESGIGAAMRTADKGLRQDDLDKIKADALASLKDRFPEGASEIGEAFDKLERAALRKMILEEGKRPDGRGLNDLRKIDCEVGVLPRTHGSAIFTRGQTQALAVTTLGTSMDEQRVEDLEGETTKTYMLHYNFPPFSVGEIRPIRSPARREIGHGALAERAIQPMIPPGEVFPYTIRIVSDILESNGSSSMATVCAGTLSLMDAGVPVVAPVAGVAMGLVKEGSSYRILTDILGLEDHHGDMDFKITGSRKGVTAVQMDLKISGIGMPLVREIVAQSTPNRMEILDIMERTIGAPRPELSVYAPRILAIMIDKDKIREVIGPGGKTIRKIIEETGTVIDIEDTGEVKIASPDSAACNKALEIIKSIIQEPEMGTTYNGKVRRIVEFGAFVEILPNKDGLLHISELDHRRVAKVTDILKEGDDVMVKVIGVEKDGKIRLSRKALLPGGEGGGEGGRDYGRDHGREGGREGGRGRDHGRDRRRKP